jgi:hypothetical protein
VARAKPVAITIGAVVLIAVVCVAVLGIRWYRQHSRGVEIRLHSVANSPLRSVTVAVTGNSYALGDLAPGQTTSVWVAPTSESGVDVSFATASGGVKHAALSGYIEPGYSGWISADLTTNEAVNIEDHVE